MRLIYFCVCLLSVLSLEASYTFKNGHFVNTREMATLSVQEHFSLLMQAYEKQEWDELIRQATIISKNFSGSSFAQEAIFFQGVGHFHLREYDLANKNLSLYLKKEATSKHFEEAIDYKFQIAQKYQGGSKKHILGFEAMPKWVPAKEDALAIYDEVIAALPHHELGALSLFGKAQLHFEQEEYQQSIESLQTLIRRFPKHQLAPESYLEISKVYLTQVKREFADPDLLDLAEINLKKFRQDFPSESRIEQAEQLLHDMQEIYAHTLYETGRFYERTKKPKAAIIYYSKVIAKYPATKSAHNSTKRLQALQK